MNSRCLETEVMQHIWNRLCGSAIVSKVGLSVQIKDLRAKAGGVLNPATPIEAIQHVITQVDLILLMSGKHFCHA